ncbi:MAG: tetratricopeptide repeat protein [Bacteroidetes bacterium]|nr:tetratricopeptide repeat protein [Bacteroidota bacterium]
MRHLIFFAFTVLCLNNKSSGQQHNGPVPISEARAAFKLSPQQPDSALAISEKLILQSQKSGDKILAAFAYKARGWAYKHKGLPEKSYPDLFESAKLFKELNEQREELMMYVNISLAYSSQSEFINSARYLILADSLAQKLNDLKGKAEIKRLMGILYREQGQYEKSIPFFKESMSMYQSLMDTISFFGAASSLCIAYMAIHHPDSSLLILRQCSPLINALQGRDYEKSMLNERFGDAYYASSEYEKAYTSYKNAYKVFEATNSKADMAYEEMNMGKSLIKLKRTKDAASTLLSSYRLNDSLKMLNYLPDVAHQFALLYQATGDWRKAYNWLEKESVLKDSLQLKSQNEKTAQLQAQYETDKKEKEISLLKKDQELSHAILQKQQAAQRWYTIFSFLILLIAVLIINRYRTIQKAKRLLEIEKMRGSIASDLHDDIGSTLSSINIMSKLALETPAEEHKINKQLLKINENSRFILENMSDIVWAINPVNDDFEKVIYKMREFAADICEPLNIHYVFTESGNFKGKKLNLDERKEIYLIFKEAINNAAKYSKCSEINIDIIATGNEMVLQVKDNGAGFARSEIAEGNGLRNMEERAGKINAFFDLNTGRGKGTSITLTIKSHD